MIRFWDSNYARMTTSLPGRQGGGRWRVKVKGKLEDGASCCRDQSQEGQGPDEAEVEGTVQGSEKARRTQTVMGLKIRITRAMKIEFD